MKKLFRILTILIATISAAQQAQPAQPPVTVIRAGRLLDPATGEVQTNQVIVIRGNRIESVGGSTPAGGQVIDLSRATVLPGLIDTHTHIFLQGYTPDDYDTQLLKHGMAYRTARAVAAARRALEQGFTTIRDVETEGAGYGDVGVKRAIEKGYVPGPRMQVVGPAISTTGGYPLHGYDPELEVPKGVQIGDGPVEMRKIAREQLEHGADWLKVYMTHRSWLDEKGDLVSQATLTPDEIAAIVDESKSWGRRVACHAYGGVGLKRALDAGCDSLEHGLDLDDSAVQQMVKQGTWYVPTLSVYYDHNAPPETPEGKRDRKRAEVHGPSFQRALKAGVKIAFGSDAGGFPWDQPIAQEFGYMVKFGMTPLQAIQAATVRAAELLDIRGQVGVIAPGAFADFIAVQGDPLKDVNVLKDVRFVMKDGKVFKNEVK